MNELIKENNLEVNQVAKRLLREAKAELVPEWLYCLQLAQWALESGEVKALNDQLQDNLENLLLWDPKEAMEFLTVNDAGDEGDLLVDLGENPEPVELAVEVLEALHSSLAAKVEGYPPIREWR